MISVTKTGEGKTIITDTDSCWIDVDKIKAKVSQKGRFYNLGNRKERLQACLSL